jgi:hypothetical protein
MASKTYDVVSDKETNILKFCKLEIGTGKNGKTYHKASLLVNGEWHNVFLFDDQVEKLRPLFKKIEDKRTH